MQMQIINSSPMEMRSSIPITDEVPFVVLYFQARGSEKWGFCGYKTWAKTLRYCTGKRDSDEVRKLWQQVFATGHFVKRRVKTKTEYCFNYKSN